MRGIFRDRDLLAHFADFEAKVHDAFLADLKMDPSILSLQRGVSTSGYFGWGMMLTIMYEASWIVK